MSDRHDASELRCEGAVRDGEGDRAVPDDLRVELVAGEPRPHLRLQPITGRSDRIGAELAFDYEGASGSVNINSLGDPLSGYIVWAVNNTGVAYNKEIFTESYVVSLLPSPPMMALMAKAQSIPSFVVGLAARTEA